MRNAARAPRGSPLGIVRSLPIGVYHADREAISNSGLNDLRRSPAHFAALHRDPHRPPPEEKPSQLEGNLMHCATLEPSELSKRYKVGPCNDKRDAEWKRFERGVLEKLGTAVSCVKPEQMERAIAQAESIRALESVGSLLDSGWPEVSAYWRDPITGVRCRCRPDYRARTGKRGAESILIDLKGYGDLREFRRQIGRMNYHQQAAFYTDGYEAASEAPVLGFLFVAVEDQYPYVARSVMLGEASLAAGRKSYRALLNLYAECLRTDLWPGYPEIELVEIEPWRMDEADRLLAQFPNPAEPVFPPPTEVTAA